MTDPLLAAAERDYLRGRVSAFNDIAGLIEGAAFDFGPAFTAEQIAELKRVIPMFCRNGACMEMVGAGVTTFDEIQKRQSSEWPRGISDLGKDGDGPLEVVKMRERK